MQAEVKVWDMSELQKWSKDELMQCEQWLHDKAMDAEVKGQKRLNKLFYDLKDIVTQEVVYRRKMGTLYAK